MTPLWLLLPTGLLLLSALLPAAWAERQAVRLATAISRVAALQSIAAGLLLMIILTTGDVLEARLVVFDELPVVLSVYLDGTSGLMLTLVAFVGWVICKYSVRYLDGEPRQGRFTRWLGLTVGAVSLLAVSGDLLCLFVAWSLSSLGIHQLLMHYSERPAARRAAWMKFSISRAADVFLIAAGILVFREFGTLQFSELFATVAGYGVNGLPAGSWLPAIGSLLITGAALKTAQFPFHTWLPETLEAPTPVSALMHAGIVNAGGYLLIRLSPLVIHAPLSLTSLAVLGAFTACFAALVMLTQTSIKRSLAWSTIAQMGFMMLQCGLGAFSAAMLHIIAHSLYKAHAFLNSGDVLNQAAATRGGVSIRPATADALKTLIVSAVATLSIFAGVAALFGLHPTAKPGGFILGFILCLGLTRWVWQLGLSRERLPALTGLTSAAVLCTAYVLSFLAVDRFIAAGVPSLALRTDTLAIVAFSTVAFLILFVLECWLTLHPDQKWQQTPAWLQATYVHASNGFYVDAALSRCMRTVISRKPHPECIAPAVTCPVMRKETI